MKRQHFNFVANTCAISPFMFALQMLAILDIDVLRPSWKIFIFKHVKLCTEKNPLYMLSFLSLCEVGHTHTKLIRVV